MLASSFGGWEYKWSSYDKHFGLCEECVKLPMVYYHITREFLVSNKDGFYQAAISGQFNRFWEVVESYMIL